MQHVEPPELFAQIADPDFFFKYVEWQYQHVSFAGTRLTPLVSRYNVLEAHATYLKDILELQQQQNQGRPLQWAKHASFMAYWLRRVSPIHHILGTTDTLAAPTDRERFLVRFANEFCAFNLAYAITRYVEARRDVNVNRYVRSSILDFSTPQGESGVHEYMLQDERAYLIPEALVVDICHCMKEKNMSPLALYLIVRSLFTRLQP